MNRQIDSLKRRVERLEKVDDGDEDSGYTMEQIQAMDEEELKALLVKLDARLARKIGQPAVDRMHDNMRRRLAAMSGEELEELIASPAARAEFIRLAYSRQ